MTSSESQPWQQLQHEPADWFLRFDRYFLRQGEGRKIKEAYRTFTTSQGKIPGDFVPGSWLRRAKQFEWERRASSYDASVNAADQDEWAQRRQWVREKEWAIAKDLLEKIEVAIANETIEINSRNIERLLRVASELCRKSAEFWSSDLNSAIALVLSHQFEVRDVSENSEDNENGGRTTTFN